MPLRKLLARELTRLLGAGARCEFAAGTVKITLTQDTQQVAGLVLGGR